jgi:hypothetical protein
MLKQRQYAARRRWKIIIAARRIQTHAQRQRRDTHQTTPRHLRKLSPRARIVHHNPAFNTTITNNSTSVGDAVRNVVGDHIINWRT